MGSRRLLRGERRTIGFRRSQPRPAGARLPRAEPPAEREKLSTLSNLCRTASPLPTVPNTRVYTGRPTENASRRVVGSREGERAEGAFTALQTSRAELCRKNRGPPAPPAGFRRKRESWRNKRRQKVANARRACGLSNHRYCSLSAVCRVHARKFTSY